MITIPHTLKFVTELDENNPTAQRLMALTELERIEMLESMLMSLVAPVLQPTLDEINAGSSWAVLKVVE